MESSVSDKTRLDGLDTLRAIAIIIVLMYRIRIPGATSIALWSYAIYLIHKPLFQVLKAPLTDYGIDIHAGLGVAIIMAISIFCGLTLYFFVETPFMKVRDRFYPSTSRSCSFTYQQSA